MIALLLLMPVAVCPADTCQAESTDSAEAWLGRIEAKATEIKTLKAKLRYDNNQQLLGDEQRRFGTLTYQAGPPTGFVIHFNKKLVDGHWSEPDLYYIYDGRWLLKRDHENKTANRYQLVPDDQEVSDQIELGDGPFPLPLNLKKDKVLAKYNVAVAEPVEDDPADSVHLQLTPRDQDSTDLTRIDLWFSRVTLLPMLVSSVDDSETQTVVKLSDVKMNVEVDEKSFDTALPKEDGWQTDETRIEPATTTDDAEPPTD